MVNWKELGRKPLCFGRRFVLVCAWGAENKSRDLGEYPMTQPSFKQAFHKYKFMVLPVT
jgi:hypothetical protein